MPLRMTEASILRRGLLAMTGPAQRAKVRHGQAQRGGATDAHDVVDLRRRLPAAVFAHRPRAQDLGAQSSPGRVVGDGLTLSPRAIVRGAVSCAAAAAGDGTPSAARLGTGAPRGHRH